MPPAAPTSGGPVVDPPPTHGSVRGIAPNRWLTASLAALIAYGLAVAGAVLTLLLVALGLVLSAQDVQGSLDEFAGVETPSNVNGLLVLLALPFQLAGMALMGRLEGSFGVDLFGTQMVLDGAGWVAPLAVTAVPVLTLWFLGRRTARAQPNTTGVQAWILSGVSGLALAVAAMLFGLLFSVRIAESGITVTLTSASWSLLAGALVIGTLASRIGRHSGSRNTREAVREPAMHSTIAGILAALRVFFLHYLAYTLVGGLALFIFASIRGGAAAAFSAPLWLPTLTGWLYGVGHLSSIRQSTSVGSDSLSVLDLPWWASLLLIVLALAGVFAASVTWAAARNARNPREGWAAWIILPVVFLAGGLTVTLLTSAIVDVRGGILSVSGTIALAPWTPLIMGLWGAAIEASARFVAPLVVPRLPTKIHRRLAGKSAGARAFETGSVADHAGQAADDAPMLDTEHTPLSDQAKKRLQIGAVSAGAVVILAVAATVVINTLATTTYGPQAHVEKYLDALQAGNATAAVALHDPNVTSGERLLLDDRIFRAAQNRITDHEIRDVEFSGETATVTAEVTQDAKTVPLTFTLEKAERTGLFFHNWTVTDGTSWTLPIQVPEGVDMVTVNGVDVELSQQPGQQAPGAFSLPVLPGDYVLTPPEGTKYVTLGEDQTITVSADPASDVGEGALFQRSMTGAVTEDAVAQAREYLQTCAASTEAAPEGCPNRAFTFGDDEDYRNFSWSITQEPEFEVSENWDGSLALYATEGEMTATYERNTQWQDDEPAEWEPEEDTASLYFSAAVQIDGDQLTLSFED